MVMVMLMVRIMFARGDCASSSLDRATSGLFDLVTDPLLHVLALLHWFHLLAHGHALVALGALLFGTHLGGDLFAGHLRHRFSNSFLSHFAFHDSNHFAVGSPTQLLLIHPAHRVVLLHVLHDHVRGAVVVVFGDAVPLVALRVAVNFVTLFNHNGFVCGLHVHETLHLHDHV